MSDLGIPLTKQSIMDAFPMCSTPGCGELIDSWPDADDTEGKLVYDAARSLWAGMCGSGHINEFLVREAAAGVIKAHDVTERILGRYVSQGNCTHGQKFEILLTSNGLLPVGGELVEGPARLTMCAWCGFREVVERYAVGGGGKQKPPAEDNHGGLHLID